MVWWSEESRLRSEVSNAIREREVGVQRRRFIDSANLPRFSLSSPSFVPARPCPFPLWPVMRFHRLGHLGFAALPAVEASFIDIVKAVGPP